MLYDGKGQATISGAAENMLYSEAFKFHNMALETIDYQIKNYKYFYNNQNKNLWPAIRESWNKAKKDLQVRYDFVWDLSRKLAPTLQNISIDGEFLVEQTFVKNDQKNAVRYEGGHE
jgi:glutathionylspermidine synthase